MLRRGLNSSMFSSDGKDGSTKGQRYVTAGFEFKRSEACQAGVDEGRERAEIRTRFFLRETTPAQPANERYRRSEGRVPIGDPFDAETGAFEQRSHPWARITPDGINSLVVRALQEIESGEVQDQFAIRSQHPVRLVRGQGVVNAGMRPDIERQDYVERIGRERKLMDPGAEQVRAGVSLAAKVDGVFAVIN